MSAAFAAVCAVLAVVCATTPPPRSRVEAVRLQWGGDRFASHGSARRLRVPTPRLAASVVGGAGVAFLVDGLTGVVIGAAAGFGAWTVIGRLEPAAERRRREELVASLPLAVDLLAACLHVGRPPAESLRVVAQAVGGPLSEELGVLAARLALGGDPVTVWRHACVVVPLAPLGRTMARSLESGAPAAEALSRLADDLRRERRTATEQAARSVGVRAAAPLGLCFLPAFVLVGIVPAIAGAFESLQLW